MADWAIFRIDGTAVVFDYDSFIDLSPKYKTKISTFPVEGGSFADYNKVQEPFKIVVRLAVGGSDRMSDLLTELDNEMQGVNLYNIVTPMRVYLNMTLESFDYKQTAFVGRGMLLVSLSFIEVRQVNTGKYTTVQVPANAATQVTGKEQAGAYSGPPLPAKAAAFRAFHGPYVPFPPDLLTGSNS
jgi:hypothetical protein